MARISARELMEWQAYENYAGPIDGAYDSDMLAQVVDQLRQLIWLFGAANWGSDNPIPAPEKTIVRPKELYEHLKAKARAEALRDREAEEAAEAEAFDASL